MIDFIKQQAKSRTIRFNTIMGMLDMLIVNAAFLQDLLTVKQFAFTILALKLIQTVGNLYYRNVTTEAISAK